MKGIGLEIFFPCVNCDLDLGDKTLSQGHDTIVWYISRSNKAAWSYGPDKVLGVCTLWLWTWRYDLGSRSWHNNCVKYYSHPIRNIATNVASMFTRTCRLSWRHLDCRDVIKICGQLWSQEQPYMKFWASFSQIYRLQKAKQFVN